MIQHIDRAIRSLYEGVLIENGWELALEELRVLANSEQCGLLIYERGSGRTVVSEIARPDAALVEDYEINFASLDPIREAVDRRHDGEWVLDRRDLGNAVVRSHRFYQDFLRPHGIHSVMSVPVLNDRSVLAGVSFQRGPGFEAFHEGDLTLLKPLMPHVMRAVRLRRKCLRLNHAARISHDMLDRFVYPLMVINGSGRILFANTAARHWMEKIARFRHARPGPRLREILASLGKQLCNPTSLGVAGMRLPCGSHQNGEYVAGLALRHDHAIARNATEPLALVIAAAPAGAMHARANIMQQLFRLTKAELRVIQALAQGWDLEQISAGLGASRETVRSHMKSIFQKTGCQKQVALQRLIIELGYIQ